MNNSISVIHLLQMAQ